MRILLLFYGCCKATTPTKNVKEYIKSLIHNDLVKRHFHTHEVFLGIETTSGMQKMRCFNSEGLMDMLEYFSRRNERKIAKLKKKVIR